VSYRLLVFDWDGTIIDSASAIVECIQEAARDAGLEIPPRERAAHTIGLGLHDALRFAVPDLPAERYAEFVANYRKHFLMRQDTMRVFEGMRELIAGFSRSHVLAIATGKSRRGLDRALDATDLKRFFMASRCADETNPKPHPAMLLELMEELEVAKDQVVMIGDTSHDMQMARSAGVAALAVTYGAHDEAGLRACAPNGCFSSVSELATWLKSNA
jgi:phosphoglycolate phosphatase